MPSTDSQNTADMTAVIYTAHHRWLLGWIKHRMQGNDIAADLAQDTFLRLLTTQDTPSLREPRAYLATIARRLVANHYRRADIEAAYLATLSHIPEAEVPDLETRAIILETLAEIDQALMGLPTQVRRAFLMSQLEGSSYAEIAKVLGVTTRTVNNYMVQAAKMCFFGIK
jgi:RNA polymerase sigma factor (sigma-70 family)